MIMPAIEQKIGLKYILRKHSSDMTETEFEDFWQGVHGGDTAALERYYAALGDRVARRSASNGSGSTTH